MFATCAVIACLCSHSCEHSFWLFSPLEVENWQTTNNGWLNLKVLVKTNGRCIHINRQNKVVDDVQETIKIERPWQKMKRHAMMTYQHLKQWWDKLVFIYKHILLYMCITARGIRLRTLKLAVVTKDVDRNVQSSVPLATRCVGEKKRELCDSHNHF